MKRDEFTPKTIRILFQRVGCRCSNPACRRLTHGAHSDPNKPLIIGEAAHITAAIRGGPRYDDTLTNEERRHISNGIWLCSNCSDLIDKDEAAFPVKLLKDWKSQAEASARDELFGTIINERPYSLVQFGFGCICKANWIYADKERLSFEILDYILGDENKLKLYCSTIGANTDDPFVVVEVDGEGRTVNGAAWKKDNNTFSISVDVNERHLASDPDSFGSTFKLVNHDISFETIRGYPAAVQTLGTSLGVKRGEWFLDEKHGSVLDFYIANFHSDLETLQRLLRLEITRLSTIPQQGSKPHFPYITRVLDVEIAPFPLTQRWIECKGIIEWGGGKISEEVYEVYNHLSD